jgi:hypothetical protein
MSDVMTPPQLDCGQERFFGRVSFHRVEQDDLPATFLHGGAAGVGQTEAKYVLVSDEQAGSFRQQLRQPGGAAVA